MIKIGLNGFGRIGRAITRIVAEKKEFEIKVINEIDEDLSNLAYLLKYDTIYGKSRFKISILKESNSLAINNKNIKFYSKKNIQDVDWEKNKVDIVIDATGVQSNVDNAKKILSKKIKKVLITHSPDKNIDKTLIMGVNENDYNYKTHNVVSTSICDASALGPVINQLDKNFQIVSGYITTLHPRLSYQNLLDGSLKSVSNPGHSWKDYSLGRDSLSNLIPKKTTAVKAVTKCIKNLDGKIDGISFRVPTSIVCASDITINIKKNISKQIIFEHFKNISRKSNIFEFQEGPLVSMDYLGTSKSVIIDAKFLNVIGKNLIKMVLWYDNEWGYSNRVVDLAKFVLKK